MTIKKPGLQRRKSAPTKISLRGIDFEDALSALLKIPAPKKRRPSKKPKPKKKAG